MCNHFSAEYVGETGQAMAKRFRQHLSGEVDASALTQHHAREHPGLDENFSVVRVAKGGGYVKRKCVEALTVHVEEPILNRRAEGKGVSDLHW